MPSWRKDERPPEQHEVTVERLQPAFLLPAFLLPHKEDAVSLGIFEESLARVCRKLGVQHWPTPTPGRCAWTKEEDEKVVELVSRFGVSAWAVIAGHVPGRSGEEIRQRWLHVLDRVVKKENWTPKEDKLLIEAYARLGSRWTEITGLLRTNNHIKNRSNNK